jgi:hypothetical protein
MAGWLLHGLSAKANLLFLSRRSPFETASGHDQENRHRNPRGGAPPSATAEPSKHMPSMVRNYWGSCDTIPSSDADDVMEESLSPVSTSTSPACEATMDGPRPCEPYVLVPRISVTPEKKTLDDGVNAIWAAIQISTQFRKPSTADNTGSEDECECSQPHSSSDSGM